jgi:hypothetical protein
MPRLRVNRAAFGVKSGRAALSILVALAALSSPRSIQNVAAADRTPKSLGDHYLMLVNTAIAFMVSADKLAQFEKSPYDGIAIAFLHAYDTSPIPSPAEMDAKIAEWKKTTKKDIWPWVYLNRMVGIDPADKQPYSNDPYFRRIAGLDLEDKTGAKKDFLQNWENGLRCAKDTGAPGIVFDFEFYNYYKAYYPTELARTMGKSPEEVIELLRQLGARMAASAAAQYPDATLWFLATALTHPNYDHGKYYPSPAYISSGLLEEIRKRNLPLKVISGGEGSLGYCHASVEQFQAAIHQRAVTIAPVLQKYPDVVELGGTMTLWSEPAGKKSWMNAGDCANSSAATVEDLEPYLELLFKSYRYNWIYGSVDGSYLPFDPKSAPRFDAVISKARANTTAIAKH